MLPNHIKEHIALGIAWAGGATQAESLGANSGASAASNTAALQAALNKTGLVTLTKPGTYFVNSTLTIGNDTTLYVGPGVTVKLAPSSATMMLTNSLYGSAVIVLSSLVASNSTITGTTAGAHGFAVGDYVFVNWANADNFSGVVRVETVPTSTTFTYLAHTTPAAASAIASTNANMTVRRANKNIGLIIDGKLDYDYLNQGTPPTGPDNMGVIMNGVHNLHVNGNFWGAKKYNLFIAGASQVTSEWLDFEGPSDGVHMLGPIHGAIFGRVGGSNDDNVFAVGTGDYAAYHLCEGTIFGVNCRQVVNNGGQIPVRFFGSSLYSVSAEVGEVMGSPSTPNVSSVQAGFIDPQVLPNGNVWIKHMKLGTVQGDTGTAATISVAPYTLDYIEFNHVVNNSLTQATPSISFNATAGKMAVVNNLRSLNAGATGINVKPIQIAGTLEMLIINGGVHQSDSASDGRYIEVTGSLGECVFNGFYAKSTSASTVTVVAGATGNQRYHFNNCRIESYYGLNNGAGVPVSVFSTGTYWGCGNADVRDASSAGTMKIYSAASLHAVEARAYVRTAAQAAEIYGWDVPVDVAILATTDGQYARNTNAAAAGGIGLARNLAGTWARI